MAILSIARMGHPVLRRVAKIVDDPTDPKVAALAADMRETLEEIGASGLAAPPDRIDPLFLEMVDRWPGRERWRRGAP